MSLVASGSIALVGFVAAPWVAAVWFRKPELAEPLRWMSLSILPFSMLNLQAECLKGVKRIRDAMLVQSVGLPLIGLALLVPLSRLAGVTGIAWAYLLAASAMAGLAVLAWRAALAARAAAPVPFSWPILLASCKPLFVMALIVRAVFPWLPLSLLGLWASAEQVGIYGAASRVAMLGVFALATINNVLVPKMAELYAKGDMDALARTTRSSALLVTLATSPLFVAVIIWNRWVMGIFGPGFASGGLVLVILAIGQLANSLTGSVNHILVVTGNEAAVRNVTVMAAVVMLLLCLLLGPAMGAVGVAIATSTAMALLNLAAAYVVWKRLGIVTIPFLRSSPRTA
jgi:O-antigen/teichoic acid export membrane protein